MKIHGLTDEDIEKKRYYDSQFFQARVPRRVPGPWELYWRLRAVYVAFGDVVDEDSGKPLFNDKAWKKANAVLMEVLLGYLSDLPGYSLYTVELGEDGAPKKDRMGCRLYRCRRGTNRVECYHRRLNAIFGPEKCGVEFSNVLAFEHIIRYTARRSQQCRPDGHVVGHHNTWLVDRAVRLSRANRGVALLPGWVCADDYVPTMEQFGMVYVSTQELKLAVNMLPSRDGQFMSRSMRYLATVFGTQYPFLPVTEATERRLLKTFVGDRDEMPQVYYDRLSLQWTKYVNITSNIWPKLPVHLRWQK